MSFGQLHRHEHVVDSFLPTSDGIQLLADVHHPKGLKKTATILVRIPFTKTFGNRGRSDVIGRYWARRGYTVVVQGTRGRYESGGQFYPLINERKDGIETLRWLAQQPWYDGRLAMWGASSFGHTQWAIADQIPLGPDALFIQINDGGVNIDFAEHSNTEFSIDIGTLEILKYIKMMWLSPSQKKSHQQRL